MKKLLIIIAIMALFVAVCAVIGTVQALQDNEANQAAYFQATGQAPIYK